MHLFLVQYDSNGGKPRTLCPRIKTLQNKDSRGPPGYDGDVARACMQREDRSAR